MLPRALLTAAIAALVLVVAGFAVVVFLAPSRGLPGNSGSDAASPSWAPPGEPPTRAATATGPGASGVVDAEWLASTAKRTGIPQRALAAYAGVALLKSDAMPACGLSWSTLAGVGYVESRHGTYSGSSAGPDGTVTPPIFGIALDGGSTENVPDSDEGAIDGDATIDRAVGPMQLIPQTWRNWHTDASGDGVEDPQNIDDAVQATANYLCRAGGDMTTEAGWRAGIAAFNGADSYIRKVAAAAVSYN